MGILLGFAPYIVFALVSGVSISLGLWLAFTAAFVITVRDFVESPTLRLLDAGSLVLFAGLALFSGFIEPGLSIQAARLAADGSFLVMAIASLLLRRPMTLEYGHEHLPADIAASPRFLRIHYVLTAAWGLAFAVMSVADTATILHPQLPLSLDLAAGLAILGFAIALTLRYPAGLLNAKNVRSRR
ncbi:MAG: hypothetical protein KGR48_07875 [Alphaproteobacteria bacterium]|nr:hypothetical protein [Alphaproteobacteria bacterium]MDE2011886.1 hypothetical protein [Alphaproteobacteria bacterium]MDE2073686.1 hypothetical protein [Alphaproteobacteria bacterium]MDE2351813.1 hypothetical protein [Alphaproteobacteria bacterium]